MPDLLPISRLVSEMSDKDLASSIVESWPEALEILSKPGSIAILLAGLFGLLVGWLLRGRGSPAAETAAPPAAGMAELTWRHEKLVLSERQLADKQRRLEAFSAGITRQLSMDEVIIRLRYFMLAEGFREARQKVGTDLSRTVAVRDRLASVQGLDGLEADAVEACREMAEAQCGLLDTVREQLRDLADEAVRIGEHINRSTSESTAEGGDLRRRLMDLKGRVLALPQGWMSSTEALDDQMRDLLAPVKSGEIEAVRKFLLVDGSVTDSLPGSGRIDLPGLIAAVMIAIEAAEKPPVSGTAGPDVTGETEFVRDADQISEASELPIDGSAVGEGPLEATSTGIEPETLTPDAIFRAPSEFASSPVRNGGGFHDLTREEVATVPAGSAEDRETSSPQVDESRSLVLFCSNNVELWGKDIYRGAHCRARPVNDFPAWAQWISIKRLDTGERVFAPVRTASLFNGQTSDPVGFNGTNELFYGARHLGIFSDKCPNEVETRFTYGGWGFGHRAQVTAPDVEQLQAAGWEGREIPSDTVFEIVIHEELPALGSQDRTLEAGGLNGKH